MDNKYTFENIANAKNDRERLEMIYHVFNEEKRLSNRVGQVEFITNMAAIEAILKPGARILDVGAGTGRYAFHLVSKGYEVVAVEPVEHHVEHMKKKAEELTEDFKLSIIQADARDLSILEDESFDLVLLFGPLYHLDQLDDCLRVLMEARRLTKIDGHIMAAFINHDMIPVTESIYEPDWFSGDTYDHDLLRINNFPFVFFTLDECEAMVKRAGLIIERCIASDGFAETLTASLMKMSEQSYQQYLKWHFTHCEKPELLGASNHFLFVCQQREHVKVSYPDDVEVVEELKDFCARTARFEGFFDLTDLRDGDLLLRLKRTGDAIKEKDWLPSYHFDIYLDDVEIGEIDLRIGYNEGVYYGGHIGYFIRDDYRGSGFAGRACKLLFPLAVKHEMPLIAISNEFRNHASRRVCEKLGGQLQRTVMLPPHNDMRKDNHFFENIYFFELGKLNN